MTNWKKYTVISISTLCILAAAKYAYSCGEGIVYYAYPSFFGNKAPGKTAYRPFFYVSDVLFYDNDEDKNQDGTNLLNVANIKEWQLYAGTNIPQDDIDSVINKFTIKEIKSGNSKNAFAHWLLNDKGGAAMDYLVYAKQCEPYVVPTDWDTLRINTDSSALLINMGLAAHGKAKDGFLKMRYAFQVLRLAFYNKQNEKTLALYDKLVGTAQQPSLSFARCLGFKAGVYFRQANYAQAAYLYSKMFDASDGLKRTAMMSFLWSVNDNDSIKNVSESAMALCKTNHERAVLTIMQALRNYTEGLPLIQKAYELDPAIEGIDVLINREINKVEERYQAHNINQANGIAYDSYSQYFDNRSYEDQDRLNDSVRKTYPAYLDRLNGFAKQMIRDKKNGTTAYWYLTSAYIQYMLHDAAQMQAAMKLATSQNMTNQEKQLYQVMLVLYSIQNHPVITPLLEAELLPQLQALQTLAGQNTDIQNNFNDIMYYLLTPKYLQQKDTVKAIYCMAHTRGGIDPDFQDGPGDILDRMSIESLHSVQAFEESKNKPPFETWLVSNTGYNTKALAGLEGTKYIRAYNFKAAAKIFANIPRLDSLPFPFEMRVNDYEDTVYHEDNAVLTNKYTFASQMAALQDSIAKNPNSAPAMYKYALGLYGMSYYGRAPHLFTYYHASSDGYKYYKTKERDALPAVFQEYYGLYTAEKYFIRAANAATTQTLKAKCFFGAAKCWQKRCPVKSDDDYAGASYMGYALSNPYFSLLKNDYSSNAFTQQVYNTCSYYRDYVNKKN